MKHFITSLILTMAIMFSGTVLADSIENLLTNLDLKPAIVQYIGSHSKYEIAVTERAKIANSVIAYAAHENLPVNLVMAVITTESGFIKTARSRCGAKGLMQIIPKYHKQRIKNRNLYDTDINIQVGTSILKAFMSDSRNINKALAKYNGSHGKHAVKYVASINRNIREFNRAVIVSPFMLASN